MRRMAFLCVAAVTACGGDAASDTHGDARIELVDVAVLGGSEEISPHPSSRVSVQLLGSDTLFWTFPTYEHGVLHGYTKSGEIAARLGGPGEGPGELGGVRTPDMNWFGPRGYVVGQGSTRLTVFDIELDTVVTQTLPSPILQSVTTPTGDLVLAPWPVDPTPVVRRGTGELQSVIAADSTTEWIAGFVRLGRAEPPRLAWVAHGATGDVYAVDGDLTARRMWSIPLPDSADSPGSTQLVGLVESDGVVWAWVSRRLRDLDDVFSGGGRTMIDSVFDTRILALDPETGAELARYDDGRFLHLARSEVGVFATHVFETEIGDTRVGVYRPALERNGAR